MYIVYIVLVHVRLSPTGPTVSVKPGNTKVGCGEGFSGSNLPKNLPYHSHTPYHPWDGCYIYLHVWLILMVNEYFFYTVRPMDASFGKTEVIKPTNLKNGWLQIRSFPFGARPIFTGELSVLGV